MLRTAACLASLAAAFAVAAPAAHAGAPLKSPSSISLAQSQAAAPSWGDHVKFNVSTTATTQPYVQLTCYQGSALVAEGWAGYFTGALGDGSFGLYSPTWTSGAADCTAQLEDYNGGRWKQLAQTSFHVNG